MRWTRWLPALGLMMSAAAAQGQPGWLESRSAMENLLGGGGACEDFETFNVADNEIAVTDCRALNCDSVCSGQGPGLVECGNNYAGMGDFIVWMGRGHGFLPSRAIRSGVSFALVYPTSAEVVGFDLHSLLDQGIFVRVIIKDADLNEVDRQEFQDPDADQIFVGYHHPDGIGEVRLEGLFSSFPVIDDHCFGAAVDICPNRIKVSGAYFDGDDIRVKLKKHARNARYDLQVIDAFGIVVHEQNVPVNAKGKAVVEFLDFNCDGARHKVRNDTCDKEKAVKKDCNG